MPRKAKELSPLEVRRLDRPGRWSVGGVDGLALQVTTSGARSWVLRITVASRQRELGLGSFPSVTLADARESARLHRKHVSDGVDPLAARRSAASTAAAERAAQQTFSDVAASYIEQHAATWKNAKHRWQWSASLKTYAEPTIGRLLTRDITSAHVIRLLEPIWATKTETASRVRSRIELILDFATARGLRSGPNPARWRGNLDAALPKPSKVTTVTHHAALPLAAMGDFMSRLADQAGVGAKALTFAILTAARSGEVRGATWSEIDLANGVWTVPKERMKSGRPHRVPLSAPALKLLRDLPAVEPDGLVFPGQRGTLSDMSLSAVLKRMGLQVTVHGFRSTFRDWMAEHTDFPSEVAEMALAHAVGDKVEAAYRRGDLFVKRVAAMGAWANHLAAFQRH